MTDQRPGRSRRLRVAYYLLWTVVVAVPLVTDFGMGLPELIVWAVVLVAAVVVTYRHWSDVRRSAQV